MPTKSRLEQIEAMLHDEPNDPELRYALAMEYMSQGNDAQAVKCFEETFAIAPNYPAAYHQAGRALQRLGHFDQARDVLLRGISAARVAGNDHAAGEMLELLDNLVV